MKKYDLFNLVSAGILGITANELEAEPAYKVMKFKRAVKEAFDRLADAEKDLQKESGIENAAAFNKERRELSESGSNPGRLAELNQAFERYTQLRDILGKEEVSIDGVAPLNFEEFHRLQQENKGLAEKPLNTFEILLEGILWAEPSTEE